MATGAQVIERLAPPLGLLPSTLERQLRAQRLAGQLPAGRPGGGKFSAHFEAKHLVNVILGLAGPEPSDAPAAAAALRAMPLQPQECMNLPPGAEAPLPTLEDQLANWLEAIAEAYRRGGQYLRDFVVTFASWDMSLCLNPRQAVIVTDRTEQQQRVIVYAIEDSPIVLRRVTVLGGTLMLAAGELLADTIKHIGPPKAVPFFADTQPAKAGAEQENAGDLRQEAPAS